MSKRKIVFILTITLVIMAFARVSAFYQGGDEDNVSKLDVASIDGRAVPNLLTSTEAIQLFQDSVERNPKDAISYTLLGQMHNRQARESGDVASYQRAEAAFRRALEIIPDYSPAEASLASALYTQHSFAEALELAQQVYQANPENIHALSTVGDAYLQLGRYQEAEEAYQELLSKSNTPAILVRLAHLAELKGNTDEALQLTQRAAGAHLKAAQSGENAAWYLLRLGDLYFNAGLIDESAEHYEAALRVFDNYYLALSGLGKARAAQGDYSEAIELYGRAVAIIPKPAILAALGDLYTKTGDPVQAQIQYNTVEFIAKLASINQQIYNRELALFYADHDLKLGEAVVLATRELEVRKDIYGYDALAWALYKSHRLEEAAEAITEAMKLGTRDAKLYYHAGMIYYGLGNREQARAYLGQALELNPHFSVLQEDIARQTLSQLRTPVVSSRSTEGTAR